MIKYGDSHIELDDKYYRRFGAGCADTLYLVVFILFFALLVALSVVTYLIYRKNQVYQASTTRFSDHEYLLRAFIDADNSLIYLKDEKLRYLFVNQAFLRFYEMKDEAAVIGKDDFAISKKEFARMKRENDLKVLNERRLITDETRWRDHIYQTVKFPVKLMNGAYGVGALVRDITDEYQSREIIRKSALCNEILYEIFSNIDIPTEEEETRYLTETEFDYILGGAIRLTGSESGVLVYCKDDEHPCHRYIAGENPVDEETACALAKQLLAGGSPDALIINEPENNSKTFPPRQPTSTACWPFPSGAATI